MRNIAFILIICTFFSCEKEIDFKGADAEIQVVINGSLVEGGNAEINLTKSKSILEDPYNYASIENAEVTLFNITDKTSEILVHLDSGNYMSTTTALEAGKEYEVSVEQPSFTSVSANQVIPFPTQIISVDTGSAIHFGEHYFDLDIRFYDEPTSDDYYEIQLLSRFYQYAIDTTNWTYDSVLVYGPMWFNSFDPIFGGKSRGGNRILLSDVELTSSNYLLNISIEDYQRPKGGDITAVLNTVSEDYYLYFESMNTQREKAFFSSSEGVPVYSNTSNGYGILGASSTVIETVKLNY
jgi:hypothetical protein